MQNTYSPSVRRRRLAAELVKARKQLQRSGRAVANELNWPHSKLTKIEAGKQGVKFVDLEALMDLYEITDSETREAMARLSRESKVRGWWWKYRDVFGERALPDFETEASSIRCYEAQHVPGLLQTPAYIEAIFRAGDAQESEAVHRHVQGRIERQHILNRVHPPRFSAILDEATLRRQVGGKEVLAEQLQHLCNMATRHNIDLRVLPFTAGEHQASNGSFMLLDFPDPLDLPIAFTETVTASMVVEEADEIAHYNGVYANVLSAALTTARSVSFIRHVMDQLV